ncbi:hypothetical protein PCE1_003637 [Barthelona sp. PCE]
MDPEERALTRQSSRRQARNRNSSLSNYGNLKGIIVFALLTFCLGLVIGRSTTDSLPQEPLACPKCPLCAVCKECETCETCETCKTCETCETCEECPTCPDPGEYHEEQEEEQHEEQGEEQEEEEEEDPKEEQQEEEEHEQQEQEEFSGMHTNYEVDGSGDPYPRAEVQVQPDEKVTPVVADRITVAILAHQHPDQLSLLLHHLRERLQVESSKIVVFMRDENEAVSQVVDSFNLTTFHFDDYYVADRAKHVKDNEFMKYVLQQSFEVDDLAVWYIRDTTSLSDSSLEFVLTATTSMLYDESIYAVDLLNEFGYPHTYRDTTELIRTDTLNMQSFVLPNISKNFILSHWDEDAVYHDLLLPPLQFDVLKPAVSHAIHFNTTANIALATSYVIPDVLSGIGSRYFSDIVEKFNRSVLLSEWMDLVDHQRDDVVAYVHHGVESFEVFGVEPRINRDGVVVINFFNTTVMLIDTDSLLIKQLHAEGIKYEVLLDSAIKDQVLYWEKIAHRVDYPNNFYRVYGLQGQNCDEACAAFSVEGLPTAVLNHTDAKKGVCDISYFPAINACDVLNRTGTCQRCGVASKDDSRNIVTSAHIGPASDNTDACYITNPSHFNCGTSHDDAIRLCPCFAQEASA